MGLAPPSPSHRRCAFVNGGKLALIGGIAETQEMLDQAEHGVIPQASK